MFDPLRQDIRYALRHVRRSPGFAAAAVLTLALGIGANTAMFTALNALVIQRLPIKDPDGLISFTSRNAGGQHRYLPLPAVGEIARDGPFDHVCGYNGGVFLSVEANGAPAQAVGAFMSGQCFDTFGVAPILGRPFTDRDAPLYGPGNRVALISHRLWTRMFGGDPAAVGKSIRTEGVSVEIIGVLPPGFFGLHADTGADVFAPFDTIFPAPANRRPVISELLGRLRPGITLEAAAAQVATRWPAVLEATRPVALPLAESADLFGALSRVERLGTGLSYYRDRYARPLTMILGLTGLLLLLACVNLGGLLLTRLTARNTELAVRLALGGSPWRIAQQMLLESLVLSLTGAALAVPVSFAFIAPLASFIPVNFVERAVRFTPDVRVLAVTGLVGLMVGILMSALPVWMAIRRRSTALVTSDRTIVATTNYWARGLLIVQVALSVVLLAGAGLLTRSLYLLQRVDLGVRTAGMLNVRVMPLPNGYRGIDRASYYPALLEKIASLPGVRSVGFARSFPRAIGDPFTTSIGFVGEAPGTVRGVLDVTSPGFFETVGIPLVAGRYTSWSDNAASMPVAVVSESLARALAPGGDVLGRRVRFGNTQAQRDVAIVGVVGNATQGNPRLQNPPVFYRPTLQMGPIGIYPNLVIATDGNLASVACRSAHLRVDRRVFPRAGHSGRNRSRVARRSGRSRRRVESGVTRIAAISATASLTGAHRPPILKSSAWLWPSRTVTVFALRVRPARKLGSCHALSPSSGSRSTAMT
jgi:putative ABC transport system permease protein